MFSVLFIRLSYINFILINISFFIFGIKFRKTKQIVVTFVATTLKALFSVAKTNSGFSGRKFYAGNIYYPFLNILTHIFPYQHIKRCATEATHRKTQTPIAATQNQINGIMVSDILPVGICAFTKFKSSMPKKGYHIPCINRKTISPKVYSVLCSVFIISHFSRFVNIFSEIL